MRAVVQRVTQATVTVEGNTIGAIGRGGVVLLGVAKGDDQRDVEYLADKIAELRIFDDEQGKMNIAALEAGASFLVVSQFTLLGDYRKGRRPSFDGAAEPQIAEQLYLNFVSRLKDKGFRVETGKFRAMMQVALTNDGPVTFVLESKEG